MFFGEYYHSIDPKNRMIIPSKYRAALGDRFIITRGFQKCLYIFTTDEWERLYEKTKVIPMTDEQGQRFARMFFSSAFDSEQDLNGRVLIQAKHREYAGLEKEIVSIGVMNHIEIWDRETWEIYCGEPGSVKPPVFFDGEILEKLTALGV